MLQLIKAWGEGGVGGSYTPRHVAPDELHLQGDFSISQMFHGLITPSLPRCLFCRFWEHSGDSVCAPRQPQQLLQPVDIHDLQRPPPAGFRALLLLLLQAERRLQGGLGQQHSQDDAADQDHQPEPDRQHRQLEGAGQLPENVSSDGVKQPPAPRNTCRVSSYLWACVIRTKSPTDLEILRDKKAFCMMKKKLNNVNKNIYIYIFSVLCAY